jgi:hypothetical protein
MRGDVVDVRPDGFLWGREECLPRFYIIKIPELKIADAKKYMQSSYSGLIMTKRRRYQIDIGLLESSKMSPVSTGKATLPLTTLQSALIDKAIPTTK